MKLPKKLNALVVDDLAARLGGVQDCLLVGYDGMPASQAFDLRAKLKQTRCRMKVIKNSLGKVALERAGLGMLAGHLKGSSAVLYGEGESILEISRVVTDWNKDKAKKPLSVRAGCMARSAIGVRDVEKLASIPSRQVLLTQVARGVAAPLSKLAGTLAANPRKLVYAVKAVAEKRGKEAVAA